ncbi:dehydrogenase ARMGADRAFT_1018426 [Trichoderma asperellum]|uniref:Dehydrogenase ARMGADRAFT_1018426 n=1 Tax=Trichoderma asperellum TaxID=101201 RepID=A0A6V8R4E1_TRIAP|nr:dehydrogenase ARMGADRAFT_1018426 [Trichoderma asperellum]
MNHFLSTSVDEVSRLSAKRSYDFIIVGTGMGGGVLARTLIEHSEAPGGRPLRVLLIERGGLVLSTHCANTSSPRWNTTGLEGPSMNTDIVFRSLKSSVSTGAKSIEYVGGPVYCIGGRSTVWGLYTPRIPRKLLSEFPKTVQNDLDQNYGRAYKLLCNESATLEAPYPVSFVAEIQDATSDLSNALRKGKGFTSKRFTCCPTGAEFTPRDAGKSLYRIPMGGFSTVDWILDRVYNASENVNLLAQTQVLTVNECSENELKDFETGVDQRTSKKTVSSLTVRDHLGIEHTIPTGNATVILSAGTLCTARIALRSGIGGEYAGSGLTDHDIWGTRFEYMPSKDGVVAWLGDRALKVQSWVQLTARLPDTNKKIHANCLLNITINAQSFLGQSEKGIFPTQHFDVNGNPMLKDSFHKVLLDMKDKKSFKVQVVFEFQSKLIDKNRVLNLPQPHETVLIESRDDNTIYLRPMRAIARALKNFLEKRNSRNENKNKDKTEDENKDSEDENEAENEEKNKEKNKGKNEDTYEDENEDENEDESEDENEDASWPEIARAGFGVVAHEVGTMRMGTDSKHSVVDENLKVHGWSNLHVCDLSVFPVSPAANPSLTLTALAQRLGTKLYGSMSKPKPK